MEILENTDSFQNFKGDNVQEILKQSVEQEIRQSSGDAISRLAVPFISNVSELTEHLILTAASCVNRHVLDSLDIKCVVNVAPELPDAPWSSDGDVVYHKIDVIDSHCSRILPFFDEASDLIQDVANSGGRSLVYCVAGVSRSASICLAYFMKHHHLTLLEAYNYVKSRRSKIRPNCGFFKQLIEYEKVLFGCNSVHMIFNEVVQMEIPDVYDSDYRLITNYSKKRCARN